MNPITEKQLNRILAGVTAEKFVPILEGLMQNPYMGVIIVDREGYVTVINDTYLKILGMKKEDVVGKHILEITPHSRLPEVLRTGEIHIADRWSVNGHEMIVSRQPIARGNCIIGAIGKTICLNTSEAKILLDELSRMEKELKVYREEVRHLYQAVWTFSDLIGENPQFLNMKSMARQAARTTSTVLITGESGTGKELFAHAIHNAGSLRGQPFVRINCAAIPENLLESELFGYEEGAFTGARKRGKPGKFELANNGTIFLDEIGDMPLTMQTKLLTVLQEKVIERVGGTYPIPINVRVIAATHRNLEDMLKSNHFRQDLYYRLNVVILRIPPLRERKDDIPLLARHLTEKINRRLKTKITDISDNALDLLMAYDWPGNVRELENLLERAINLADMNFDTCIMPQHLPSLAHTLGQEPTRQATNLNQALDSLERELILRTLEQTGGNKLKAARLLGIHTSVLYRKLKKYGISD